MLTPRSQLIGSKSDTSKCLAGSVWIKKLAVLEEFVIMVKSSMVAATIVKTLSSIL